MTRALPVVLMVAAIGMVLAVTAGAFSAGAVDTPQPFKLSGLFPQAVAMGVR